MRGGGTKGVGGLLSLKTSYLSWSMCKGQKRGGVGRGAVVGDRRRTTTKDENKRKRVRTKPEKKKGKRKFCGRSSQKKKPLREKGKLKKTIA